MRRGGQTPWRSYTPYELRNVGAFIRLGQRHRAHELLDWFMSHRRPLAWKQWAEVVHHLPETPISIGDMPHTWVGSDFVRSLRSCLLYERQDGSVIVGAGIKYEWLFEGDELRFQLPTAHGSVCFSGRRSGYRYRIHVTGTCTAPVILQLPWWHKGVSVDGQPGTLELPVQLPAEITLDLD